MLDFDETVRLILASNIGVEFIKSERTENDPDEREFYFLMGEKINFIKREMILRRTMSHISPPQGAIK